MDEHGYDPTNEGLVCYRCNAPATTTCIFCARDICDEHYDEKHACTPPDDGEEVQA